MVRHPLEVLIYLQTKGKHSEIMRKWLIQRHQSKALLLDLNFLDIDASFSDANFGCLVLIPNPERIERTLEHLDRAGRHTRQFSAKSNNLTLILRGPTHDL